MPDEDLQTGPWTRQGDLIDGRRAEIRSRYDATGVSAATRESLRRYTNDVLALTPDAVEACLAGAGARDQLGDELIADIGFAQPDPNIAADIAAQLDAFAIQRSIASNDPSQLGVQRSAGRVDVFSGQATYEATDLMVRGAGVNFAFRRTYASQCAYRGPLGANWTHPYNLWLREVGVDLLRSVRGLREDAFTRHPGFGQAGFDYWVPPDGQVGVIRSGVGVVSFVWQGPGGQRILFEADPAHPLLHRALRHEDRFGNGLDLEYDDEGRLAEVRVNHPDRRVRFVYDLEDRIVELHDYTGRACRYTYDDFGDLVEVTSPVTSRYTAGLTTAYEYMTGTAPAAHNLVRVIQPNGRLALENEFGGDPGTLSFNRVIRQLRGHGESLFEYELVANEFDFDYTASERPALQVNQTHRNGNLVHVVLNGFGNVILREEPSPSGREGLLQWRFRYDRDGRTVAALTPEGSLTQCLFGRERFLRQHGITDDEVQMHPALTDAERMAFGNLLATVRRGSRTTSASLDWSNGVWGSIFADVFDAQPEDVIVKRTYEPDFQQVTTTSDPRFTRSADPQAVEAPEYQATLTRREYTGPAGAPNLLLARVRHPDKTRPDGTVLSNIRDEYDLYDGRGRLGRRRDASGTITEFSYYGAADGAREGYLRSITRDSGGLEVRTEQEVDVRGRPTAIHRPRSVGAPDGHFVTHVDINELDQVERIETSPPFSFVARWSYDRAGGLERLERQLLDETGAPKLGGVQVERFTFDVEGNITRQALGGADPATEIALRHEYDAAGLTRLTVSPTGRRTRHHFDSRMREMAVTRGAGSPEASTVRVEYDGDDRRILVRSGRGFATRYGYDPLGRLTSTLDARGNLARRDYDKAGDLIVERYFERRPNGSFALLARSELTYDQHHRPVRLGRNLFPQPIPVDDPIGDYLESPGPGTLLVTEHYYDEKGRLERVVDPLGRVKQTEFDALDRVIGVVDAAGNRTEFAYDADDNVVRRDDRELVTDVATGAVIGEEFFSRSYDYDELDRLRSQTDPLGNVTTFEFDSLGRVVVLTDPLGNVKRTDYDLYGRVELEELERTSSGLGGGARLPSATTHRNHDADGNLMTFTDPAGNVTQQRFDGVGRRRTVIHADDSTEQYTYDADDNLLTARDANGVLRTYAVNELDRTERVVVDTSAAAPGGPVEGAALEQYTYDALGRLLSERNDYLEVASVFDSLGRATSETWSFMGEATGVGPLTLGREFDAAGSLIRFTYPDGRVVRYHRDALGLVARIENLAKGGGYPGSATFADAYDIEVVHRRGGRREGTICGNGTGASFAYDGGGRLIEAAHLDASGGTVLLQQYLHDAVGNVRLRNDRDAAAVTLGERFRYDSLYALATIERANSIPLFVAAAFAPSRVRPPTPMPRAQAAIDAALGPFALDLTDATLVYDIAGNRELERRPNQLPIAYVPNELNQYESVAGSPLSYDAAGNLRSRETLRYVYDSRNLLVRVLDTAQGNDVARFFHDTRGRRIAEERGGVLTHLIWEGVNPVEERRAGDLFLQYVHDDAVDSICQLVHSGSEYWVHRDAIGSARLLTDNTGAVVGRHRYSPFGLVEQETGPYNPVRFTGRRFDVDALLYDMRARSYSPELGRFLQRDPKGITGGWNLYRYAATNPLTYTDPMGTDAVGPRTHQHDFAPVEVVGKGTTASLIGTAAAAAREAWNSGDVDAARFYEQEVTRLAGELVAEGQVGMAKFGAAAYLVSGMAAVGGEFFGLAGVALATEAQFGATATFLTVGGASGFGSTLYGEVALLGLGWKPTPGVFVTHLGVGTAGGMLGGGLGALKFKLDLPVSAEAGILGAKVPSFAVRTKASGAADSAIDAIVEGIGPSPLAEDVAVKVTVAQTTNARLDSLLDVAESGGLRWIAGDPEMFAAYEEALPAVGGAQGRAAYNTLRRGMGELVDIAGQPIHHWRFPITQYGAEAVSAENLYLSDDSSLHIALHKAVGTLAKPFAQMEFGAESEVQSLFNFLLNSP
jgi:RHS repeat-associated protein